MKLIVAVFALFAVASAFPVEEDGWVDVDWSNTLPRTEEPGFWDGRDIKPAVYPGAPRGRIVGGQVAAPNAHPYQAALHINTNAGQFLCGGSIISGTVVLSAAHCHIGSNNVVVILGAHFRNVETEATQWRTTVLPAQYRIHAQYTPANLNNDIGTLLVPTGIPLNAQRAIIALVPADVGALVGEVATVSGWGRTSDASGAVSAVLNFVSNIIISNAECFAVYGGVVVDSTICKSTAGGQGTCGGDSGGPLTIQFQGIRHLCGVVSFGAAAGCELGFPAGYARVSSFLDWIAENSQ